MLTLLGSNILFSYFLLEDFKATNNTNNTNRSDQLSNVKCENVKSKMELTVSEEDETTCAQ